MPSPFPGMNPYLEQPSVWAGFHNRLIVALALGWLARPRSDALEGLDNPAPDTRPEGPRA